MSEKIKIGKLVKKYTPLIVQLCKDDNNELSNLQYKKYSKEKFNLNYPFFKKVNEIKEHDKLKFELTSTFNYRYWKDIYIINQIEYRVTSQWFEYNKNDFIKYLQDKQILQDNSNEEYSSRIDNDKKSINKYNNSNNFLQDIKMTKIKNILLYGVPGVGKTHNYKKLLYLIEEEYSQSEIFNKIQENSENTTEEEFFINKIFNELKDDNQIEFITFHQSYSYEDFIEGFRPQKSGNIELEDGIFKSISNRALENLEDSQKSLDTISQKYNFENLLDAFKLYIEDKLSEGEFILKNKATIDGVNKSSFNVGGSVTSGQKLTFDIIQRDYEAFKNGQIQDYRDIKSTFESKRGIHGNAPYYFALYHKLKEFEEKDYKQNNDKVQKVEEKNYYLVIDEINRGNISKIFGELITLIEEDKRDSYEVTLPYSKEKFKIPSNLYIIATMNSTDKSIATMDIALRRRFTFIKMKPNSDLVKNTEAQKLMIALNNYITETRGEDYQLGHSYFMGYIDLEFVIEYKIKPLLEEYFYGDDEAYKKAIDICSPR
ncbi:ATPase associated with various cellular activities, AAA_5 [hydrothermal vent metagenome]|uniref:ATPase associated with various cellular activities, AAA_5 n=1 Tax=hydrothermal vent metagenome TaxID=652676 RepID=A0A1W1BMW0_9ZZZZ